MTHLWFDTEAAEAAEFYLKVFENSRLLSRRTIPGTPSGDVDSVTLDIEDHNLMMISAGPYFKVNPALERVTKAFLQMKKFDLAQLEKAYRGE